MNMIRSSLDTAIQWLERTSERLRDEEGATQLRGAHDVAWCDAHHSPEGPTHMCRIGESSVMRSRRERRAREQVARSLLQPKPANVGAQRDAHFLPENVQKA
jgi:hypothetical protein